MDNNQVTNSDVEQMKIGKIKKVQTTTDEQSFSQSYGYFKQIANCLAYQIINSEKEKKKTQVEQVQILTGLGFERQQIAAILNTSIASINARLAEIRKNQK